MQKMVLAGRIITGLVIFVFVGSGITKFVMNSPEMKANVEKSGMTMDQVKTIGVIELVCVAIYAVPQTAVLGAILLTGYMGGAIFAHLRMNEAFIFQFMIGVLAWLGIYLREPRLWAVVPWRNLLKSQTPPTQ